MPGFVTGGLNLDTVTLGWNMDWLNGGTQTDTAGLGGGGDGSSWFGGFSSGNSQTITTNLDGRTIARVIMPYIVEELNINGTTY